MFSLFRLPSAALVAAGLLLSACSTPEPEARLSESELGHYAERLDGDVVIPAVDPGYLTDHNRRQEVAYTADDAPGTIVVDPYARLLYHVEEGGRATRYGIAVGREGRGFRGSATIRRKEMWPSWAPTANMIRTMPETYAQYAGGLPGGIENPLGARALYLYRGGRDTMFRIHGTNNASTIGRATSAGCIRLFNQDIIDLFEEVDLGTKVHVRTLEESLAIEGPMVELENGYVVPEAIAAEAIAELERAQELKARQEARAARKAAATAG